MPATLKIACIAGGSCIRVEGRATMKESIAAREMAARTLGADPGISVTIDLFDCDYLDSTFLGCLVELHRNHKGRFRTAASLEKQKKLLSPLRLDKIIPNTAERPVPVGAWVDIPVGEQERAVLLRHVMQCHRILGEHDTPMKAMFLKIADQMQRELTS